LDDTFLGDDMPVIDVNLTTWEHDVLDSDTITIVEFWHQRCPWCKQTIPLYDALSHQYGDRMKFTRFNVLIDSENREFAMKQGVRGTPTFIFFCEGQPVGTKVGFQSHEQLTQSIEAILTEHSECLAKTTKLPSA
jgi:thioredoxin 1